MPRRSSSRTALAPDLSEMVEAVRIVSAERFEVLGNVHQATPLQEPSRDPADEDSRDLALPPWLLGSRNTPEVPERVVQLESLLYWHLYTRSNGGSGAWPDEPTRRRFVLRLSEANRGRGTWEAGWTIGGPPADGRIPVHRNDLTFEAPAEWVRIGESPAAQEQEPDLRPGQPCRVWIGKELREMLPGFYLALGDADEPEPPKGTKEDEEDGEGDNRPIVIRLYWNLTAEGAPAFLQALTSRLNAAGVPFRGKVLDHPIAYRRADAGVVYLDSRVWDGARRAIEAVHRNVAAHLRPEVPRCTRKLAPGLGVAEDPGNGQSFGQHRCRLVAQAVWRAFDQGAVELEDRSAVLAAVFQEEGLDPTLPHRGPGSRHEYPAFQTSKATHRGSADTTRSSPEALSFLEAAARIGDVLCRDAYHHGDRCNWVGRSQKEVPRLGAPLTATVAALGPTIYDGTAGVALFLAQLGRETGDPDHRRTALAAIRQALAALGDESRALSVLGLYTGVLGVQWAARRVGGLLGESSLEEEAHRALAGIADSLDGEHDLDVIAGNAGAIPVLLALHRDLDSDRFLPAARRLGEELCETAIEQTTGRAWDPRRVNFKTSGEPESQPWTGLSHGAAGMAHALFELYGATGRRTFLETALDAVAWEDSLFDADRGNWLDTRFPQRPTYATAWCHGAPGIALSRLGASRLDPERSEEHRASSRAALATTRRALETARNAPGADTTPCHGLSGLAEVLLLGSKELGDDELRGEAEQTLHVMLDRYGAGNPWPCGTPSHGPNPSLMLGMAGVGYTLLRLHDPEGTPSVLWVGSSSSTAGSRP